MSTATVSVITIVYNDAKHIARTIQSVLGQDYPHLEYIIVDGASTDGTSETVAKYADRIHTVIREPDRGIYDAMNKGQRAATGEYVIFINSGDELEAPSTLSSIFKNEKDLADIYYGETLFINEKGETLGTRSDLSTRKLPATLKAENMLDGMVVCHQSIMVRRSIAPAYDLRYSCSADIDWVVKSLKKAKTIRNTGGVIAKYLTGGYSAVNRRQAWKERFLIYGKEFGWGITLLYHVKIAVKYLAYLVAGKKNL
ncbi:glycosyl transferase [Fulvitalea axinellae]|uniref:Glycosyl transferase n=1 Tax=Fulvitalea axinellae TaxID=1182444 RepID=A0AAU9CR34_9BACT|nr:glycosyl transferase [Fulvitalea axinellae]